MTNLHLTESDKNVLIHGLYLFRAPVEDQQHDDRTGDFAKKLNRSILERVDALIDKIQAAPTVEEGTR